jgi:hypothetical protein
MRLRQLPPDAAISIPRDHALASRPKIYGAVGAVGLVLGFALEIVGGSTGQLYFSYLVAFMYFLSFALGGLFFVIVQFLVRAGWSVVVRRTAENLMGTLPIFAVLFIPVAIGLHHTHHHWVEHHGGDPILEAKSPWLNVTAFYVRAAIYLGLWSYLAFFFRGRSVEQDKTGDHELTRRMQKWSGPSLAIFALSLTFAAVDWMMSTDPHWYSTMFGVYYFAGSSVSTFALLIVLAQRLQKAGFLREIINQEHYHDLGKFLFGFVVFWTYIAFSQYFLIWYANIPEETLWYQHRTHGSWSAVGIFLMVGHFFLPFFYLLPRTIKRLRTPLLIGASWILFVHYIDLYWVLMPIPHPDGFAPSLLDLACFIGVGGVFLAMYSYNSAKDPLIPVKDPRLPESLAFENF